MKESLRPIKSDFFDLRKVVASGMIFAGFLLTSCLHIPEAEDIEIHGSD